MTFSNRFDFFLNFSLLDERSAIQLTITSLVSPSILTSYHSVLVLAYITRPLE